MARVLSSESTRNKLKHVGRVTKRIFIIEHRQCSSYSASLRLAAPRQHTLRTRGHDVQKTTGDTRLDVGSARRLRHRVERRDQRICIAVAISIVRL